MVCVRTMLCRCPSASINVIKCYSRRDVDARTSLMAWNTTPLCPHVMFWDHSVFYNSVVTSISFSSPNQDQSKQSWPSCQESSHSQSLLGILSKTGFKVRQKIQKNHRYLLLVCNGAPIDEFEKTYHIVKA